MSNSQRERRVAPYYGGRPTSSGPWWLGFNDARNGHDYWNDYLLKVDQYEYQQGYAVGSIGMQEKDIDRIDALGCRP